MLLALVTADMYDIGEWISVLEKNPDIEYDIIDISQHNWMDYCLKRDYNFFLLRPPGLTNITKQMFEERVIILSRELKKKIYPSLTEIMLYENKKYLSYWLKANVIPCPRTDVFYSKKDAISFIQNASFPIVAKTNVIASGQGIKIIKNSREAQAYVNRAFSRGIRPYFGPNLRTASIIQKARNIIKTKGLLKRRLDSYKAVLSEAQKYVILQEYIKHSFEWRAVVIGDSYFAHKKVVTGMKASGSLVKDYGNPPISLLDFIRKISLEHGIISAAIDVFDSDDGYLVNEIQTYFGQSDPYQMKVDGVVGRYRYLGGEWVFESGDYASNQCYDLRINHALSMNCSEKND